MGFYDANFHARRGRGFAPLMLCCCCRVAAAAALLLLPLCRCCCWPLCAGVGQGEPCPPRAVCQARPPAPTPAHNRAGFCINKVCTSCVQDGYACEYDFHCCNRAHVVLCCCSCCCCCVMHKGRPRCIHPPSTPTVQAHPRPCPVLAVGSSSCIDGTCQECAPLHACLCFGGGEGGFACTCRGT